MNNNAKGVLKYIVMFLLVSGFFIVGFFTGRYDYSKTSLSLGGGQYTLTGDLKSTENSVNVNILWEVWDELDKEYINSNLDGQKLIYGAVKGLISSLDDPYTAFLTPAESVEYMKSNKGEYDGIGATLKQVGTYAAIESSIDNTPAQKAGLLAGDVILEVDHQSMENKTVYDVVGLIRGVAGTQVTLKLHRPSTNKDFDVTITRGTIAVDNVSFKQLPNGIAELKVYKFTEADVNAFNKLWDQAVNQVVNSNAKGVVIDLRNNPGGFVSAVEYALGEFFPKGTVVFMEESKDGVRVEHKVSRDGRLLNMPVVVLVNEGSASASEIFSGAIQDLGRGKIVGTNTVGKGVEQKLIPLSDGSLLQVVFQRWLTPKGNNISKDQPIHPDIIIEDPDAQDQKALDLLK
jgi:carboxyl-terminal processing protease